MIQIEELRRINRAENIVVTAHGRKRMAERGILLRDVMNVIEHGEIIEQYPADTPCPSCLILGTAVGGAPVHVVVGTDQAYNYLVTTYFPDADEWESDWKTRKERS